MLVVAKSVKGHEFLYSYKSAHKIPQKRAKEVCKILNDNNFQLKENEVWFIHDVDQYDTAFQYAEIQKFTFRKNQLFRVAS